MRKFSDEWECVFLGFYFVGILVLYVAGPIFLAFWGYPRLIVWLFPSARSDLGVLLGLMMAGPTYVVVGWLCFKWEPRSSPSDTTKTLAIKPGAAHVVFPPQATPLQTAPSHPPAHPKILSQAQRFFMRKIDELDLENLEHPLAFLFYWVEFEFPPAFEGDVEAKFDAWVQSALQAESYGAWVEQAPFPILWLDDVSFLEMRKAFASQRLDHGGMAQADEPETKHNKMGEGERIVQEFLTRIKWLGLATRTENALGRWVKHLPSTKKGIVSFDVWEQSILDAENYGVWLNVTGFSIRNFGPGMFSEVKTALAAQAGMDEKEIEQRFVWHEALLTAQKNHSALIVSDDLSRQQEEFISGLAQLELYGRTKTVLMKWVIEGFPDTHTPIMPDLSFKAWGQTVLKASSLNEWSYAFRDFGYRSYSELKEALAYRTILDKTAETRPHAGEE